MSASFERTLSAAGKLFLSGEYAVLWGGTARLAAVGPRAFAHVRSREDRELHLVIPEGRFTGRTTPMGAHWDGEVPEAFSFAARTVSEALRAHGSEALGFDLWLSRPPEGPEGKKLGLGGSARTAVLTAEAARSALDARFDSLKLALVAHAGAQGGKGSGGDVAAIFAGGLVRYRRWPVEALAEAAGGRQFAPALAASAPVDLWRIPHRPVFLAYAFTGASASTRKLIGDVESKLSEAARRAFVAASDEAGQALEDGLCGGGFALVAEACQRLEKLLGGLGPVETEATQRILALAHSYRCAGKISGAGGGDGCILFCPGPEERHELLQGLETRGILALPLEPQPGLQGEAVRPDAFAGWR